MGLLTIIKKQKMKENVLRCLILGLDNSGKSTIVNKLLPLNEQNSKIIPTIGFQINNIVCSNDLETPLRKECNVSIWDVGGQTTLRPFWDNYFDKTDVLIWCIDISLKYRFNESVNELIQLINRDENRIGYSCSIIILLNKIDLLKDDEVTKTAIIQDFKQELNEHFKVSLEKINFIECSGITGEGLDLLKKNFLYLKDI